MNPFELNRFELVLFELAPLELEQLRKTTVLLLLAVWFPCTAEFAAIRNVFSFNQLVGAPAYSFCVHVPG